MVNVDVAEDLQGRLDKINQIKDVEGTKEMLADMAENIAFLWNEFYNLTDALNQLFPNK